jgi:hypothetical protein
MSNVTRPCFKRDAERPRETRRAKAIIARHGEEFALFLLGQHMRGLPERLREGEAYFTPIHEETRRAAFLCITTRCKSGRLVTWFHGPNEASPN